MSRRPEIREDRTNTDSTWQRPRLTLEDETTDLSTLYHHEPRPLPTNESHQSLRSRRSQYEFKPFSRSPDFSPRNRSSSPSHLSLGHTPLSTPEIEIVLSVSRSTLPSIKRRDKDPSNTGLPGLTIGSTTNSLQDTMKSQPTISYTEISGFEECFHTPGSNIATDIAPRNCFVRCPKITFLIGPEGGDDGAATGEHALECQICLISRLEIRPASSPKIKSDTRPAILPCGHVFGHRCLAKWLRSHSACPCCRLRLRHRVCGHRVEPRVVDSSSILHLPRTLSDGGVVGDLCGTCREQRHEETEAARARRLRKAYCEARDVWRASGDARDQRAMQAARDDFEELGFASSMARLKLNHAEW